MDDAMDIPSKNLAWEESRRTHRKDKGEDKRRERDARERRFDKEEQAPRRDHTHEKQSSQEQFGFGDQKERKRNHKRRKSATPIAANKDRHHSPFLRRSPPYKWRRNILEGSHRKNLGYEGGRGLAIDNRLERFDGTGLHLSGKTEDQSRSNCAKFQGCSGFSMRSCPTISYADSLAPRKEGLLSYKKFIVELEDDISPGDALHRYEAYKTEYIKTQKRAFFKKHKDEDWFREKYDPTRLEAFVVRRNENAKIRAKELIIELQAGSLCLGTSVQPSIQEESENDADCVVKRRKSFRTHFKIQKYNVAPEEHLQCYDPKRVLNDIELERSLIKKLDVEKGIGANILLTNEDFKGNMSDKGPMVTVRSCKEMKELEGGELAKVMRTYLWHVHFVDYYGMIEYKEQRKGIQLTTTPDLKSKGDMQSNEEESMFAEWEKKLETTWQTRLQTGDLIESMLGMETLQTTSSDALDLFVRKIRDEKYGWKYGCGAKGCTKLFHGPEFVHKHLKLKHHDLVTDILEKTHQELYFQNYMSDVDAPGVNLTTFVQLQKNFNDRKGRPRGPSKPLHVDIVEQKSLEKLPPNIQLQQPCDTKFIPRTNEPFEECTRARDNEQHERGSRQDESHFDRETLEHSSPPCVFPPLRTARPPLFKGRHLGGCFEHMPIEPLIFDHFNGPPLQILPGGLFVPDIPGPPQVLMPVPGAGPLGPFVPAPPRMAMRFLIEGPDSFHGGFEQSFDDNDNGQLRGHKIPMPIPMLGGSLLNIPSMMIPPHVLHHDPRGIRSYHDLDMPGDEVTVIDYRSL